MSDKEIWKDIDGYEGYYQVSNMGRVRSLDRLVEHPTNGARVLNGELRKLKTHRSGYHHLGLTKDGETKYRLVHRLVAQAFIPNPESKPQVNHIDGVKTNNNVSNLEWATHKENTVHAVENKLIKTKLSKKDVLEIRCRYNEKGESPLKLAEEYSVTRWAIYDVVNYINWKHI